MFEYFLIFIFQIPLVAEAILDLTAEALPRMVCQCTPCNQTVEVYQAYPDEDWKADETKRIRLSLAGGLGWCDNHRVVTETGLAILVAIILLEVAAFLTALTFWAVTKIKRERTFTLSDVIASWDYPPNLRRVDPVVMDAPIFSMEMMMGTIPESDEDFRSVVDEP